MNRISLKKIIVGLALTVMMVGAGSPVTLRAAEGTPGEGLQCKKNEAGECRIPVAEIVCECVGQH